MHTCTPASSLAYVFPFALPVMYMGGWVDAWNPSTKMLSLTLEASAVVG